MTFSLDRVFDDYWEKSVDLTVWEPDSEESDSGWELDFDEASDTEKEVANEREFALVVGAWAPGISNKTNRIITVALDSDNGNEIMAASLFQKSAKFIPDFIGDIMKISVEELGKRKFSKIVFQGVCPVADSMGAPCKSGRLHYQGIAADELAWKLRELISDRGGFVFFRHCLERAHKDGVLDSKERKAFIDTFQSFGFVRLEKLHPPYRVISHFPGLDIPDNSKAINPWAFRSKWEPENGGMVFFFPSCS